MCLSGKLQEAGSHLRVMDVAPETRKDRGAAGAWSQGRVSTHTRRDLGRAAPSQPPSPRKGPVTLGVGLSLPEPPFPPCEPVGLCFHHLSSALNPLLSKRQVQESQVTN